MTQWFIYFDGFFFFLCIVCIVLVDLKQSITETIQDPLIRRTQKYTPGLDGLFSFHALS